MLLRPVALELPQLLPEVVCLVLLLHRQLAPLERLLHQLQGLVELDHLVHRQPEHLELHQ